jgi:hypothetical protein
MADSPRRIFLGWDAPLLPRAADWLLQEFGQDLRSVVVALPGGRAARKFLQLLVRRARPDWTPPRVLTQGELTDELVRLERPAASRLARTLAWERALRGLAEHDLARISARRPHDAAAWRKLAALIRTLHGELAPEGLDFAAVERALRKSGHTGEAERWAALALAQAQWRALLEREQLCDPHAARLEAIDAGAVHHSDPIVLVGVADMNHLLRRTIERVAAYTTALVSAPHDRAASFDAFGCLRTDVWQSEDAGLALEQWRVVDRPADQAEEALRVLAEWNGRFGASQITIGVADEAVTPELERRLAAEDVFARGAAGIAIERTPPMQFLASARRVCERGSFREWAAFVRHPDVEHALAGRTESVLAHGAALSPAAALDRYHAEHLPGAWSESWLASDARTAARFAKQLAAAGVTQVQPLHLQLAELERATRELLGPLALPRERPLRAWPAELRRLLEHVYGARELDPSADEDERVLARALTILRDGLAELETLPAGLAEQELSGADALALLLEVVQGAAVPARHVRAGEDAIELLGWLELALDDAPVLVVTGFNEGSVPDSRRDDPFLPDTLRRTLGLASDADRLARDVYATRVVCASRKAVCFVSGRRGADGEPRLPSRISFRCADDELLARARKFVDGADETRHANAGSEASRGRDLPRTQLAYERDSLSVSAFADYLRSPYGFYLRHVLGLEELDDSARELDGRAFGTLAHEVLCDFGREQALRDVMDERALTQWLHAQLARCVAERFGKRPLAAVRLQVLQLERRLAVFARGEVQRRADGWRIAHCEWQPSRDVFVPGVVPPLRLRGRIDRIDERVVGGVRERAILDYKTADEVHDPASTHRGRSGWKDLQLPLYALLAAELGDEFPALGYLALGQDDANSGVRLARWTEEDLESALEAAREVAEHVRAGDFFELGRGFPPDPAYQALAGRGLVGAAREPGEEPASDEAVAGESA